MRRFDKAPKESSKSESADNHANLMPAFIKERLQSRDISELSARARPQRSSVVDSCEHKLPGVPPEDMSYKDT